MAGPTQLNPTEQDALVKQIGLALLRAAPADWASVEVAFRAIGRYTEVRGQVSFTDERTAEVPIAPEVVGLFVRLRAGMYREGRGTWFNARYQLDRPAAYNLEYDRDEPRWQNPPPPPAFLDELRMFPRDEENIPEWLARRLAALQPPFRTARIFDGMGPSGPVVNRPPLSEEEREQVQRYLDAAPLALPARGYDVDHLDEERRQTVPVAFHTDGTWIWPAAVNFYLRTHGVTPDPDLVAHARRGEFRPGEVDEQTRAAAAAFIAGPRRPSAPPPRPAPDFAHPERVPTEEPSAPTFATPERVPEDEPSPDDRPYTREGLAQETGTPEADSGQPGAEPDFTQPMPGYARSEAERAEAEHAAQQGMERPDPGLTEGDRAEAGFAFARPDDAPAGGEPETGFAHDERSESGGFFARPDDGPAVEPAEFTRPDDDHGRPEAEQSAAGFAQPGGDPSEGERPEHSGREGTAFDPGSDFTSTDRLDRHQSETDFAHPEDERREAETPEAGFAHPEDDRSRPDAETGFAQPDGERSDFAQPERDAEAGFALPGNDFAAPVAGAERSGSDFTDPEPAGADAAPEIEIGQPTMAYSLPEPDSDQPDQSTSDTFAQPEAEFEPEPPSTGRRARSDVSAFDQPEYAEPFDAFDAGADIPVSRHAIPDEPNVPDPVIADEPLPPMDVVARLRARLAEVGVPADGYTVGTPTGPGWTMEQTGGGWRVGWFDGHYVAPAVFADPADAAAFLAGKLLLAGAGPTVADPGPATVRASLAELEDDDDDEYDQRVRRPLPPPQRPVQSGPSGEDLFRASRPVTEDLFEPRRAHFDDDEDEGEHRPGRYGQGATQRPPHQPATFAPGEAPDADTNGADQQAAPETVAPSEPSDSQTGRQENFAPSGLSDNPAGRQQDFAPSGPSDNPAGRQQDFAPSGPSDSPAGRQENFAPSEQAAEVLSPRRGARGQVRSGGLPSRQGSTEQSNDAFGPSGQASDRFTTQQGSPNQGRTFPPRPGPVPQPTEPFTPRDEVSAPEPQHGGRPAPNGTSHQLANPAPGQSSSDSPDQFADQASSQPLRDIPGKPGGQGRFAPQVPGQPPHDNRGQGRFAPQAPGQFAPQESAGQFATQAPESGRPGGEQFADFTPQQTPEPSRQRTAPIPHATEPSRSEPVRKPEPPSGLRRPQDWPIQPLSGEPPLTLFRGKQVTELPPGTEIDRYGEPTGNLTYAVGTPFDRRSLVPDWINRPYHAYRVVRPTEALTGAAIPWFDQPGGGSAFILSHSVADLVESGHLAEIPDRQPPSRT